MKIKKKTSREKTTTKTFRKTVANHRAAPATVQMMSSSDISIMGNLIFTHYVVPDPRKKGIKLNSQ